VVLPPSNPPTPHTQVEYDLEHSSKDDLRLLSMDRVEQSAVPTAITWYPSLSKESFLLLANDQVGREGQSSSCEQIRCATSRW